MPTFQELDELEPSRNVVFTAIEKLKDAEAIQAFFQEYCDIVGQRMASKNVGYILGYYRDETIRRWFDALPTVYHPIFGRTIGITPEEAFKAGQDFAKSG